MEYNVDSDDFVTKLFSSRNLKVSTKVRVSDKPFEKSYQQAEEIKKS